MGFESPSIIEYLEPLTGDNFITRFADYQFDELVFLKLGGEKQLERKAEFSWNVSL